MLEKSTLSYFCEIKNVVCARLFCVSLFECMCVCVCYFRVSALCARHEMCCVCRGRARHGRLAREFVLIVLCV